MFSGVGKVWKVFRMVEKKLGKFSGVGNMFKISYLAETLSLGADNLSIPVPNHLLVLLSRER